MNIYRILERVSILEQKGRFVVIDAGGKVHGSWRDRHHAVEHQNLINSIIEGTKNAFKDRKQSKDSFKQHK